MSPRQRRPAQQVRRRKPTFSRRPRTASSASIRRDFILSAVFTVPLLVIAMSHGAIPGTDGTLGRWLQFALATPVVFGPGRRFFRLAWAALATAPPT